MVEMILITGAKIVTEGRIFEGDVRIENDVIVKITSPPAPSPEGEGVKGWGHIEGRGKYLLPGVIDDHVHFREPGLTGKGDIHTESKAAVAGGVTSYMDMPNTIPKATTLDILEEKYTLAGQRSYANYSFFLGATNDNILEIEKADPSRICGLKVFMGASTGNMLVDDPDTLERIFKRSPLLIAVHAEEQSIIQENLRKFTEKYSGNIPFETHPLIRSEEACYQSSEKAVKLARKHGTRIHLMHLSTAKELDLLDNSIPLEKKKITSEVCVNHLWFDDRDYRKSGSRIKWNPAIKKESDKKELLRGVLDNRIDIIATDHAPHTIEEKQNPYLSCPSGAPLVQHSLVAMLELYHRGEISIEKIVDKMCHGPAILYRIKKRGFIREGYFADLVLVDLYSPWEVNLSNILYKCGWSPLEGQSFSSMVTHTIVNGCIIYENGNFDETLRGMRLEFNPDLFSNREIHKSIVKRD
jgi:dihydroorotase